MHKLLIATTNKAKLEELKKYLSDLPLELVSLTDVGITRDYEETGNSFEKNSKGKARFYSKLSGLPSLSDDGGLEINALNGEPGIHSKRWVGENPTDKKILEKMKKVSEALPENNRTASFSSVVTVAFPNGDIVQERGTVSGIIAKKPIKSLIKGFPYRSYLYIPEIQKYYHDADLSPVEEKLYNHRYKAVQKLKPKLLQLLTNN